MDTLCVHVNALTEAQKNAFKRAADRWSRVIVGDLPSVIVGGEVIDDLLIEAQGVPIDGTGSILGQAGPTNLRPASAGVHRFLPAKGIMSFDTADLAKRAFGQLRGSRAAPVPVENLGGPGTRDSHWRESVFRNELMSGFIAASDNPLSKLTVASLEDLGYEVSLSAAEPYSLPNLQALAEKGLLVAAAELAHAHALPIFSPTVLPDASLVV